jgi:hypothetical protein
VNYGGVSHTILSENGDLGWVNGLQATLKSTLEEPVAETPTEMLEDTSSPPPPQDILIEDSPILSQHEVYYELYFQLIQFRGDRDQFMEDIRQSFGIHGEIQLKTRGADPAPEFGFCADEEAIVRLEAEESVSAEIPLQETPPEPESPSPTQG